MPQDFSKEEIQFLELSGSPPPILATSKDQIFFLIYKKLDEDDYSLLQMMIRLQVEMDTLPCSLENLQHCWA